MWVVLLEVAMHCVFPGMLDTGFGEAKIYSNG